MKAAVVIATVTAAVAVSADASTLQGAPAASQCVYADSGALPDPTCTPGASDPSVTQANIHQTICVPGYSSAHRPDVSVTEPEKFASMRAYGVPTSKGYAGRYEYDHLVSIELGGAVNDPKNLFPEAHSVIVGGKQLGSYTKDALEDRLHSLVCKGSVPLLVAQTAISTDWVAAYQQYVGSLPR